MTDNRRAMIEWGDPPDITQPRHEPPELCPGCHLPVAQGNHRNCTPGMWRRARTNPRRFKVRRSHVRAGVRDTAIEIVAGRLNINRADAALIVDALDDGEQLVSGTVRAMSEDDLRRVLTTATGRIIPTGQDTQETNT